MSIDSYYTFTAVVGFAKNLLILLRESWKLDFGRDVVELEYSGGKVPVFNQFTL